MSRGIYNVTLDSLTFWDATWPLASGTQQVNLSTGLNATNINFGTREQPPSVSGFVFHDRNRNGLWDGKLIAGSKPDVCFRYGRFRKHR